MKKLTKAQKKKIANHWMAEILRSSMEVGTEMDSNILSTDYDDIIQLVLDKANAMAIEGRRMGSLNQIIEFVTNTL